MTLRMHVPPSGGVYRYLEAASEFATPPSETWSDSNYWVSPFGRTLAVSMGSSSPVPLFDPATPIANPRSEDSVCRRARDALQRPRGAAELAHRSHGVRVYNAPDAAPDIIDVYVYDEDGNRIGQGQLSGESRHPGMSDVQLQAPVRLEVGKSYTVSYLDRDGLYAENHRGFLTGGRFGIFRVSGRRRRLQVRRRLPHRHVGLVELLRVAAREAEPNT